MSKNIIIDKLKLCTDLIKDMYIRVLKQSEFSKLIEFLKDTLYILIKEADKLGVSLINTDILGIVWYEVYKVKNTQEFMVVESKLLKLLFECGLDYYIVDSDLKVKRI